MFGLSAGMVELMIEMAGFLGVALFLGLIFGYLVWGWRRRAKLEAARAEGAASVRTSVDGDASLRAQLDESIRDRGNLKRALEAAHTKIASLEAALSARPRPVQSRPPLEPVASADPDDVLTPFEAPRRAAAQPGGRFDPAEVAERLAGDADEYEYPAEEETEAPLRATYDDDGDAALAEADEDEMLPDEILPEEAEPEKDAVLELTNPLPSRPKLLLPSPPNEIDDLTQIEGIGAVMEGMLNDIGVFLYHQLANFSDEDMRWIAAMLEVNVDEIHDAGWKEQAQELYREKYGLDHDA